MQDPGTEKTERTGSDPGEPRGIGPGCALLIQFSLVTLLSIGLGTLFLVKGFLPSGALFIGVGTVLLYWMSRTRLAEYRTERRMERRLRELEAEEESEISGDGDETSGVSERDDDDSSGSRQR